MLIGKQCLGYTIEGELIGLIAIKVIVCHITISRGRPTAFITSLVHQPIQGESLPYGHPSHSDFGRTAGFGSQYRIGMPNRRGGFCGTGQQQERKEKTHPFFALSRKCNTGSHRRYSSTIFRMLSLCRTSFHQNVGMKKAPICFRVETDWRKTYDKND